MLDDQERKLLRVLYNYFARQRRMPDWRELSAMTYRSVEELVHILTALENKNYIYWDNKEDLGTLVMIEGWERQTRQPRTAVSRSENASYWTQY
ncbi:hypothetical protein [Paenibacillus bovis]|uniref:LexA repressor DNA-binding domain-containing protein n=1 Tax=Paenibacillus bovis TaxID=1616788 RepID=A0A172ZJ50_9BACL|nr:hypothetical protein [Paenibacillus bovis]ANF97664.1 hypothetical protein AR543_17715 [Paenibacillus bovis]